MARIAQPNYFEGLHVVGMMPVRGTHKSAVRAVVGAFNDSVFNCPIKKVPSFNLFWISLVGSTIGFSANFGMKRIVLPSPFALFRPLRNRSFFLPSPSACIYFLAVLLGVLAVPSKTVLLVLGIPNLLFGQTMLTSALIFLSVVLFLFIRIFVRHGGSCITNSTARGN